MRQLPVSRLTARQHDRANEWDCTVTRVLFYGTHTEYVVRAGDEDLTVTTRPGDDEFAIGVQAWLTVEPSDVRFLPN